MFTAKLKKNLVYFSGSRCMLTMLTQLSVYFLDPFFKKNINFGALRKNVFFDLEIIRYHI